MDRAIAALKEKYPEREIRTFDTKSISLGAGFQVRYAAEKYRAGATMDELDAYLRELSAHTVVYFVVDDLVYLKRGGRISALTATFGKLLNIKPMISILPDGSLQSVRQDQGRQARLFEFIRIMHEHHCNVRGLSRGSLAGGLPRDGRRFRPRPERGVRGRPADRLSDRGPVIASHCGPGTLGLIFYGDK